MISLEKIRNRFQFFIVDFSVYEYVENFLLSTVFAIIVIRIYLKLTGYFTLSTEVLHIAHMLWGGLLMLISLFILLSFLNKEAKQAASVIGGLGFGTFIDELGKFITQDNNYFFRPTFALIYLILISLFLIWRYLREKYEPTQKDYAVNALELIKEVIFYDLDKQEKQKALYYLKNSQMDTDLKQKLIHVVEKMPSIKDEPSFFTKTKNIVTGFYKRIVRNTYFSNTVVYVFVFWTVNNLINVLPLLTLNQFHFWDWGVVIFTFITDLYVLRGIYFLLYRKKRLIAFEKFKTGVLISIFFTHFFLFYERQLSALFSLFFTFTIYVALSYLIEQEKTGV